MFYLYILKSQKSGRLYFGYTSNLKKRFEQHNKGMVTATKTYCPWKLIYYEAYSTKQEAIKRENNLKLRANAWNQLKLRIKDSITS